MELHFANVSPECLAELHKVVAKHNHTDRRAPRMQLCSSEWSGKGYKVEITVSSAFREAPVTTALMSEVLAASGQVVAT